MLGKQYGVSSPFLGYIIHKYDAEDAAEATKTNGIKHFWIVRADECTVLWVI